MFLDGVYRLSINVNSYLRWAMDCKAREPELWDLIVERFGLLASCDDEWDTLETLRERQRETRQQVWNRLREPANKNYEYTMDMLFNTKGVKWKNDSTLCIKILPKLDGTVDRVEVMARWVKIVSRDSSNFKWKERKYGAFHPCTREAKACANLIGDWKVTTLDGKIRPVFIDIRANRDMTEYNRYWSRGYPDSVEMNGTVYCMDAFPLQYDPELLLPIRTYLKGAFTTENPRGYRARWEIIDERLKLTEIRNACTGELIPLATLVPGNDGTPVEASWYTGTFEIATGEDLDFLWHDLESRKVRHGEVYRRYIERREIVCEVEQGRIVRQTVYDNYIQPGDTTAYKHCIHMIRTHDWHAYPELEEHTLCGGFTVYPRGDGVADSITNHRLHVTGKYPPYTISDPVDPRIELIRCAAETVSCWEVRFFRGKVEPLKVTFLIKKNGDFDF